MRVAPFTRDGRASSASSYKRLHLHVPTRSSSCHCRGYHCLRGYCHRHVRACSRERRMSVTYREGAIDSKRAHVQTAHYLPARRTRTEIIDKRILACIEMQKGYSLTLLCIPTLHLVPCIYAYKHGEDHFLPSFAFSTHAGQRSFSVREKVTNFLRALHLFSLQVISK